MVRELAVIMSLVLSFLSIGCANLGKTLSQESGFDFRKTNWGYSQGGVMLAEQGMRILTKNKDVIIYKMDDIDCKITYCFKDNRLRAAGYTASWDATTSRDARGDVQSKVLQLQERAGQTSNWDGVWTYIDPVFFEELKKTRFVLDELTYYEKSLLGLDVFDVKRHGGEKVDIKLDITEYREYAKESVNARLGSENAAEFQQSPDGVQVPRISSRDMEVTHRWKLEGHTGGVLSVAFSPDGQTVASGSSDYTIRLWDTLAGEHKRTLEGHKGWVHSIVFSPNGRMLASGSEDKTVQLWDAVRGTHRRKLKGHTKEVLSVAFSPDGRTVASGSSDNTIRLWYAVAGVYERTLQGHTVNKGATHKTHTDSVTSVAFSPDGRMLASGSSDGTIRLWPIAADEDNPWVFGWGWHPDGFKSVAFSPDGIALASGSWREIRLWDVVKKEHKPPLSKHTDWVNSVAFSPDGLLIASGSDDRTVCLWNAVTGEHKLTLEGHTDLVTSVAFSPDGRTLASGSHDGTVILWELLLSTDTTTP